MSLNQLAFKGNTTNESRLIDAVNQIILGNTNNTGTVTLEANATSTTVLNSRVGAATVVLLIPTTANAAAGAATTYVTTTKGQFTITHANNAQTDRTFKYIHVG